MAAILIGAIATADAAAPAPDYAREERWAQEVTPSVVVGDAVWLATPKRSKVLALLTQPQGLAKGGIVLVHGLGVHPDFGIVGALRSTLADAGYATLAVQMPVLASDAAREDYAAVFVEAGERIAAAAQLLRERKSGRIAIVSHSMGAAMANAWLAQPGATGIDAWVPIGMMSEFATAPRMPVLDILAQLELEAVDETAPARRKALPRDACSAQITVPGNDHYFERGEVALTEVITRFLERAFADRR